LTDYNTCSCLYKKAKKFSCPPCQGLLNYAAVTHRGSWVEPSLPPNTSCPHQPPTMRHDASLVIDGGSPQPNFLESDVTNVTLTLEQHGRCTCTLTTRDISSSLRLKRKICLQNVTVVNTKDLFFKSSHYHEVNSVRKNSLIMPNGSGNAHRVPSSIATGTCKRQLTQYEPHPRTCAFRLSSVCVDSL